VNLVLDASIALSWFVTRSSVSEAILSQKALQNAMVYGALIPHLWYSEVMNGIILAERHGASTAQDSSHFFADLDSLPISLTLFPSFPSEVKSLSRLEPSNLPLTTPPTSNSPLGLAQSWLPSIRNSPKPLAQPLWLF